VGVVAQRRGRIAVTESLLGDEELSLRNQQGRNRVTEAVQRRASDARFVAESREPVTETSRRQPLVVG
jgi:hypothetical protein